MEEVRRNIVGYRRIKELGLDLFVPEILDQKFSNRAAYILMEDCGEDLITLLRSERFSPSFYEQITGFMSHVYRSSLRSGEDGRQHVEFEIRTAKTIFTDFYLRHFDVPSLHDFNKGLSKLQESLCLELYCFASWDFMPGNICLTPEGVKFLDPPELVTGVPILDLACLAGVFRDVHNAPGSKEGAKHFRSFALSPLADLFCITSREADDLYVLGRLTQSLLSFRESCLRSTKDIPFFGHKVRLYLKQLTRE